MAKGRAAAYSGWGRVADYLFGRNALIGVASLMLLAISGFATWSGMADFIIGVQSDSGAGELREIGGLSLPTELFVIAIVVTLTFLMWLALRETFGAQRRLSERLITLPLYLFLALWSIGFGYGFWWSLIAGSEATRTSLSGLQEDARDAAAVIAARLDAVRIQLDNVVTWSDSQMAREETSGGSCGVTSGAGRGPLYNARKSVRDAVASVRDGITNTWLGPIQSDVEDLRQSAASLEGATVAERQKQFEAKASEIRGKARNIAARSNALGQSMATEMRALAKVVSIPPGKVGFSCYDPTLAQRLTQAADQAGEPAVLNLREAAFNEGPAGVANAIKRLWSNIGTYVSSLVSYIVSGGKDTGKKTEEGTPITGRDLIALLATIGIDLGLFVLVILNPPATPPVRHEALASTQARLNLPTQTVIRHVTDAVNTAIARAPGADLEWVRRHFLHHNKASYFVIPNLYSADPSNKDEAGKALAMNQLAGVLDDLDLVRWPTKEEFEKLRKEEDQDSLTDLTDIRKKSAERKELDEDAARQYTEQVPLRNHGLFSKAERMLEITGWSEKARSDIEIFVLEDTEGLTPLLTVLSGGAPDDSPDVGEMKAGEVTSEDPQQNA
jgi:hypothetical protein